MSPVIRTVEHAVWPKPAALTIPSFPRLAHCFAIPSCWINAPQRSSVTRVSLPNTTAEGRGRWFDFAERRELRRAPTGEVPA